MHRITIMRLSERLLERLKTDFPNILPVRATLVRIRRGYKGKNAGTWAWEVVDDQGKPAGIGSEDTMKRCIQATQLGSYWLRGDFLVVAD